MLISMSFGMWRELHCTYRWLLFAFFTFVICLDWDLFYSLVLWIFCLCSGNLTLFCYWMKIIRTPFWLLQSHAGFYRARLWEYWVLQYCFHSTCCDKEEAVRFKGVRNCDSVSTPMTWTLLFLVCYLLQQQCKLQQNCCCTSGFKINK